MQDSFIKEIVSANKNFNGKIKSITFIVIRETEQKKIFKWFFKPNSSDFYISFPYYKCEKYHCGVMEIPKGQKGLDKFDAVSNAISSTVPVKFSYHKDGNVHFKPTEIANDILDKSYKLASIQAVPIAELNGDHIFTIQFEGLSKYENYGKPVSGKGHLEVKLPVPEDIVSYKILAYAGPNEKCLEGKIKEDVPPWFVLKALLEDRELYIGIYAILSRKSHIQDNNKNGLVALVGFDKEHLGITKDLKSLYLFAR
jgi:hypothetical protein